MSSTWTDADQQAWGVRSEIVQARDWLAHVQRQRGLWPRATYLAQLRAAKRGLARLTRPSGPPAGA